MRYLELTDKEWSDEFGVCPKDENGEWHYDCLNSAKAAAGGNIHRLWTIVQGGGTDGRDTEWICAGVRIVNRISYLVSKKEWTADETKAYLWFEYHDSEEQEEHDMDITGWMIR
tara:strand:- start:1090 stop:1431 length:342 start_codon:yes stop_codon:yes gene_type:complete